MEVFQRHHVVKRKVRVVLYWSIDYNFLDHVSGILTFIDFATENMTMNVKRLRLMPDSLSDPAESIQIGFPFGNTIHNNVFVSMHAHANCSKFHALQTDYCKYIQAIRNTNKFYSI